MTIASLEKIVAKAEKRFDETGSLQGFKANARSGSREGVTGLSVSALATGSSNGKDDTILAYTLDVNSAIGKAGAAQSGFSAQQIEELMDFLGGIRSAATQKAALRSDLPKDASAAVDAYA